jgi:hypothetical protein
MKKYKVTTGSTNPFTPLWRNLRLEERTIEAASEEEIRELYAEAQRQGLQAGMRIISIEEAEAGKE